MNDMTTYKIVLLGDKESGKTMLTKALNDEYSDQYQETTSVNFSKFNYKNNTFQVWDLPTSVIEDENEDTYLRGADAFCICVPAITEDLECISKYLEKIKKLNQIQDKDRILLVTKIDESMDYENKFKDVAHINNINKYYFTSAKNQNTKHAFVKIAQELIDKKSQNNKIDQEIIFKNIDDEELISVEIEKNKIKPKETKQNSYKSMKNEGENNKFTVCKSFFASLCCFLSNKKNDDDHQKLIAPSDYKLKNK